mmetsp:Transcript_1853/g.4983  ORF Transcript_1853/g.4983 Transcript_1853/m.4983 type:complete len:81 (-) Transcript_1853:84-326(-)
MTTSIRLQKFNPKKFAEHPLQILEQIHEPPSFKNQAAPSSGASSPSSTPADPPFSPHPSHIKYYNGSFEIASNQIELEFD